jgi:hypothetical protein
LINVTRKILDSDGLSLIHEYFLNDYHTLPGRVYPAALRKPQIIAKTELRIERVGLEDKEEKNRRKVFCFVTLTRPDEDPDHDYLVLQWEKEYFTKSFVGYHGSDEYESK